MVHEGGTCNLSNAFVVKVEAVRDTSAVILSSMAMSLVDLTEII